MGCMTLEEFKSTMAADEPPAGISAALRALWYDAKGDWPEAHRIAQDIEGPDGSWIHAYLHRKEGDLSNAGYWYRRASRPIATDSLEQEWERMVEEVGSR